MFSLFSSWVKMYTLEVFSGKHRPLGKLLIGLSAKHFHQLLENTTVCKRNMIYAVAIHTQEWQAFLH